MTPTICTHGISLDLDCKLCDQDNKVYDKERIALGKPVKEKLS